jgi:hypothetical protein
MIATPMAAPSRSAAVRPNGTDERAIGIDRKRSMTPSATSLEMSSALAITPAMALIANRPGMRYSR